jgi:hypothetical protein
MMEELPLLQLEIPAFSQNPVSSSDIFLLAREYPQQGGSIFWLKACYRKEGLRY